MYAGGCMLTFYHYARCTTCINAKKYLTARGHTLKEIDITVSPPPPEILAGLIEKSGRPYTDFLNRSGVQYRDQNMKEKLKHLSTQQIVKLLAADGRLIKRPIVTDGKRVTVGFKEEDFDQYWSR
jgi:arsenate reductase (glutaredoxin)